LAAAEIAILSKLRSQADSLGRATVEDVRAAHENVHGVGKATGSKILRAKSLLGYAHEVGYTPFNAGAVIKIKPDSVHWRYACQADYQPRGDCTANQAAPSKQDRVLLEVT